MKKVINPRKLAHTFKVEAANSNDAQAIAKIQHDSWLAHYPDQAAGISYETIQERLGELEKRVERWQSTLEDQARAKTFQVYVVRDDGAVVGYCKLVKGEAENHIDALYVDSLRKKQGAGGLVFKAGLLWLGDDKPISLEVVSYNTNAIQFYERFGFKVFGPGQGVDLRNGQSMPDLVMRRPAGRIAE